MWDGDKPFEKLVYFLEDGRVHVLKWQELMQKSHKELEYVLYLLKVKDNVSQSWAERLKKQVDHRGKLEKVKPEERYVPKYIDHDGNEQKMIINSAFI